MGQIKIRALAALGAVISSGAAAQDVRITTFKSDSTYSLNERSFTVERNQNTAARISSEFALTSRACPPDCLQPMQTANGVETFGELELLDFLEDVVSDGRGLLIDSRTPEDFARGSIPSAINVPFLTLQPDNRYRADILRALGAVSRNDGSLDFTNSMALALYGGGVWSDNAPKAIELLLDAGYPAEKLFYYRGGMQAWVHVGLTAQPSVNPG